MAKYEVGKIYHPDKTYWQDGTDFNFRSGVLELRMFFSNLTRNDIQQIKAGKCIFYFTVVDDIIFFMFDFGKACPLSDNSYTIHLVPENEKTIPSLLSPNEKAILTIILVSSEDGIIRALRQISLSHDFSKALYNAIIDQNTKSFNKDEHDKKISDIYKQFPTTHDMLKLALSICIVESKDIKN